jgi:hypothetical protein
MTSYQMNEGAFEIDGADLSDATLHAFDARVGDAEIRLVVERGQRRGRSLDAIAAGRAEVEAERLPAYALLAEREVVYGGAPAVEVCASFRRSDGEIAYLRRTHVAAERMVMSFTMSAPLAAREASDSWMDAALESLQFRADG